MKTRITVKSSKYSFRQAQNTYQRQKFQKDLNLQMFIQNKDQLISQIQKIQKESIPQKNYRTKNILDQSKNLLLNTNRIYNASQTNKNQYNRTVKYLRNSSKFIKQNNIKFHQKRPSSSQNQIQNLNLINQNIDNLSIYYRPGSSKSSRFFRKKQQRQDKIDIQNIDNNIPIKITNEEDKNNNKNQLKRAETSLKKDRQNIETRKSKLDPQFFKLFAK